MNLKKTAKTITICLYSFITSILLLAIPVLFATKLKPLDQKYLDLLLPIARPAYMLPLRSNDARNYILGLLLFTPITIAYFILYWKDLHNAKKTIVIKKFIFILWNIVFVYVGLLAYKIYTMGKENTVALVQLDYDAILSSIRFYSTPIILICLTSVFIFISNKLKLSSLLASRLRTISLKKMYLPGIIMNIIVLLIIIVLLFNPRYKYSYEKIANYGGEAIHQFHHSNFFIAPVNEVINGKMLLVNTQAQYGILSTYFQSIIFGLFGLTYANFNLYCMSLSIIYTFIFYLFVSKITRNRLIGLVATLGFIKIFFFRTFWPYEVYTLPSTTPIRYFFDIISIYFVYKLFEHFTFRNLIATSIMLAIAFFYNTEIGLSLIIAYIGMNGINLLININKKKQWMQFLATTFMMILSLIVVAGITTFITYLRIHQFPDWFNYFRYVFIYGRGAYDVPMPLIGPYYFIMLTYIVSFYLLIHKFVIKNFKYFSITLFILIYGIFSFFYYAIFSEPHHYLAIVHPAIILSFILIKTCIDQTRFLSKLPNTYKTLILTFIFFIIGYIFWSSLNTMQYIQARFNTRYAPLAASYNYWKYSGLDIYLSDYYGTDFFKSADVINKFSHGNKDIVILSRYDTMLYIMTHKTSFINHPIAEYDIGFIKERQEVIDKILIEKPRFIYVFNENYKTMVSWTIHEIWDAVKTNYSLVENAGVIDVYELKR